MRVLTGSWKSVYVCICATRQNTECGKSINPTQLVLCMCAGIQQYLSASTVCAAFPHTRWHLGDSFTRWGYGFFNCCSSPASRKRHSALRWLYIRIHARVSDRVYLYPIFPLSCTVFFFSFWILMRLCQMYFQFFGGGYRWRHWW